MSALPLRIDGLVKRFGQVTAVDGISLEVRERECLGLLGPNGAGKSTTIRSIVGRVKPDAGTVQIFGSAAESREARAAIGWVPQEIALYPLLTCRENLDSFGRYQGLSGNALRDAITWCLKWATLEDRAGAPVKELSGGMKRRLNMACGLIYRPKMVLMDEPTVGVDPQSRNHIFEMIEALRAEGMAIIYTTHYMEEAERLCDRIAIIDHGKVIASGTRDDLVHESFGGRSDVLMRIKDAKGQSAAFAAARGGTFDGEIAHFSIEQPTEIAGLLDGASKSGLEVIDVVLRRPNLESVFLQLTGRDLRE
ncbi:ABC transporter ATP-binding protein [Candidatus Korobacter versatilis]|nr:ABC transporter ATP-binding protein [Candidatus Koribacter versatilis]